MSTAVLSQQHETVDALCQRFYGRTAGVVEAVLDSNPGLAALGTHLPNGTKVVMPDIAVPAQKSTVNLWD